MTWRIAIALLATISLIAPLVLAPIMAVQDDLDPAEAILTGFVLYAVEIVLWMLGWGLFAIWQWAVKG